VSSFGAQLVWSAHGLALAGLAVSDTPDPVRGVCVVLAALTYVALLATDTRVPR
jgi:hypothetical protein